MTDSTTVIAAGTALASAVAYLFRVVMRQAADQTEISERVGRLEGEQKGIESLSKKTLETVHKAIAERDESSRDG